ncbi:MAG: glycerol-3-phosphate 1-O-acyltransferase PlsY [Sedimentisphaeraceae bacterium JB056]
MEINYNLGILVIAAYLLGSVPFGLLIARTKSIDLRSIGSGNIGATNVGRALGRKWAYVCFLLDAFKGALPMIIAANLIDKPVSISDLWLWVLVGCAAVAGHMYPVYINFKGGKGVATSLGMVLGLWPYYTTSGIICFSIWAVTLFIWKYVSLSSIIAALLFPIVFSLIVCFNSTWEMATLWPLLIVAIIMGLLVVIKHRENITRLKNGTENKVFNKNKQAK